MALNRKLRDVLEKSSKRRERIHRGLKNASVKTQDAADRLKEVLTNGDTKKISISSHD